MILQERRQRTFAAILLLGCLASFPVMAQSVAPRLYYSDLESGPNSGGENGAGAIVTIYGSGFEACQEDLTLRLAAEELLHIGFGQIQKLPFSSARRQQRETSY